MGPVIESIKKTNRAVVAEEGWKSYGFGSEVRLAYLRTGI